MNLGNLHEDLGEREAAQAAYQRVLDIDPANTMALAKLATASLSATVEPQMEARLRSAIDRPERRPRSAPASASPYPPFWTRVGDLMTPSQPPSPRTPQAARRRARRGTMTARVMNATSTD